MTIIDPAGAFAQAMLITGDQEILLWPGTTARTETPGEAIPFVTSISMELAPGMGGKIFVSIASSFEDGLLILKGDLLRIGNILAVQFSYPLAGLVMPWYEGVTVKPEFEISGEGFTATLSAEGGVFAAERTRGVDVWVNRSYADIIRDLAARPTNNWNVVLPDPEGDDDPIYGQRPQVSQGSQPDWVFIGQMARSSSCDVSFGFSDAGQQELRILRRSRSLGAPPVYSFVFRGQCDFETTFPLFSAKCTAEGSWLPAGNAGVIHADIHPESGEVVGGTVTPDATSQPRLGGGGMRAGAGATPPGANTAPALLPEAANAPHVTAPASSTNATPAEVARGEAENSALLGGINLDIETMGLPGLWPEDNINIGGIGVFSGNYSVRGIRHEWSGGWTMGLTLLTNSQGGIGAMSDMLEQNWPSFNDQEPSGTPADGSTEVQVEDNGEN